LSVRNVSTIALGLLLTIAGATPAYVSERKLSDYEDRIVGNWITSAKVDRFGGDGGTFIAATVGDDTALFVRCLQKELSIAVSYNDLEPGDKFLFKFRVDTSPVVESAGLAINKQIIQVKTPASLVKAIRDGKETATRIESELGVSPVRIFDTRGARAAFADLSQECPLD
jgi:hypothetical protein